MFIKKCRMCTSQQELYYIFSEEFIRYVEYLRDYTKTQVHRRDELPTYLCRSCLEFLDDHYDKRRRHGEGQRTCQYLPETNILNLDDEPIRWQPSEYLDLRSLWQVPETQFSRQFNLQSYHCVICNQVLKNKLLMVEHLTNHVSMIKCGRCTVHCPIKLRYSKVTVYTNLEIDSVIAEVLMGTSGEFWIEPADGVIRVDRVLPMPSDEAAIDADGVDIDVTYRCHMCYKDFLNSWKAEQHIHEVHLMNPPCNIQCVIHCQPAWQKQRVWVQKMRTSKAEDARNEIQYMVGLTNTGGKK